MGIFSRLGTLFKSNINEMISQAEDPEKMLNQVLVEMREQLVEAKKQVVQAIADEKRLKKQTSEQKQNAQEWENKAMLAVRAQNDDLARQALQRKQEMDGLASELEKQWHAQVAAVEQLKEGLRLLTTKIDEAKRKKHILIARKKRAEAQKTIHQTMQGLSDVSAFETFDRMAAKVDQMEAEAEASVDFSKTVEGHDLDKQFAQLERGATDQALLALKQKMGALPASATTNAALLPAANSTSDIDDELAALKAKLTVEK